ncbi:GNAT family N-acetyltransferase [Kordiimonas sp.]|uniref:GNAT family N-acetyltransferase n=1 Tax=Kordiimonas sp. TaxID=1970157 RepID=UPI003A93BAD9
MQATIRQATRADATAAYSLVCALADHENAADYLKISEAGFTAAAFGETPAFHVLIAEHEGQPVGIATYITRFHIWTGSTIIELDDLYVSPAARGLGIGTSLLKAVGKIGKKMKAPVKWQVNTDNTGAINLYKRMGADYAERGICFWRPENIC